ncbi:hypothetical protein FKW77_005304 [Venturia effusa]|uniref:Uncharacterized protein n=1 Tax=Venturia effusa TaxID=50376 RepID=A0A517LLH6_9PEZI|nr:hypothetical protein FKW77_005304 [Venturia effusa]
MKINVSQVALTVLGLASLSFAAPAVNEVPKQLDRRSGSVCIDMWQDTAQQTPIRLSYCNPQDQCVPWNVFFDAEPRRVDVGAIKFEGTCCTIFEADDCNALGNHDLQSKSFCEDGVNFVPKSWHNKVGSIQCYETGWNFRRKRDTVTAAAAVPPLPYPQWARHRSSTITHVHRAVETVSNTTSHVKTVYTTRTGFGHATPTISTNVSWPVITSVAAPTGHNPKVERDVKHHISYIPITDTYSDATHTWYSTVWVGFSVTATPFPTVTVTKTISGNNSITAVQAAHPGTTNGSPWHFPTSVWLSGSGSAMKWSTSTKHLNASTSRWWPTTHFDLGAGVSSVVTAPTSTTTAT